MFYSKYNITRLVYINYTQQILTIVLKVIIIQIYLIHAYIHLC